MTTATTATDTPERIPAAVLTEHDLLILASEALQAQERLRTALRASEDHLRVLRRQIEAATGYRGLAPHHLSHMCRARGLL